MGAIMVPMRRYQCASKDGKNLAQFAASGNANAFLLISSMKSHG